MPPTAPLPAIRRAEWQPALDLAQRFDTPATAHHFRRIASSMLTADDERAFESATGFPLSRLISDPWWSLATSDDLREVMSTTKVLPHPLNVHGLHPLRALLAERVMRHVAGLRGATSEPWYETLVRHGLLVLDVPPSALPSPTPTGGSGRLQLPAALEQRLHRLLATLSSPFAKWSSNLTFGRVTSLISRPNEKQFYMHVDTYQPTWRVWAFFNASERAAFHFVRGSHTNDARKLKWLYERTRELTNASAILRPSPRAARTAHGPFRDATHGFEASMRVVGFDPLSPRDQWPRALHAYGYDEAPVASTAGPALHGRTTLVIADTSGFHFRGAAPWEARTQATLQLPPQLARGGEVADCGPGCLRRRSPFHCEAKPHDC